MKNCSNHNLYKFFSSKIICSVFCLISFFSINAYSQTWSPLGSGMNDWVYSSIIYNGDLIVGGKFTSAGGVSANHIAKWNGTSWQPLGSGVNGKVNALAVYEGNLVAAGEFTSAGGMDVNFIAMWDGTAWNDELGGVGSTVTSLAVIGTDLYVGGYFTEADSTPANYIAKRDNTGWSALGTGMAGGQGQVMALTVFNGELYAGGFFTSSGGVTTNHIAKWNGISWSALGNGIAGIVYSLAEYNGNLVAGGLFLSAGIIAANHIASWDGVSWSTFGTGMAGDFYQYVFALAVYNGNLFAGGYFQSSGGVSTNGVAKWDGASWSGLNGGFFYPANACGAHTLCIFGGDLVVGGLFTSAGSVGAAHIAAYNEPISTTQQLNLTVFLEGFFDTTTGAMNQSQFIDIDGQWYNNFPGSIVDTLSVQLTETVSPYNIIYHVPSAELNTNGTIDIPIPLNLNGSYYVVIKHRNSIETWSANPVQLMGNTTFYDFTDAASKAFGNNLLLKGGIYTIFSGDVNQDGIMDSSDIVIAKNDASVFNNGYIVSDINGDGITDAGDLIVIDNNSSIFIGSIQP
jgi:hypothetical protein